MKIFNWVHRRFNHKDGLPQNGKKTTAAAALASAADEKQYFLPNNGLSSNIFGSWKGGLLAIGTFGYDPLPKMDDINRDVNYQESDKDNLFSALQETDTINDYDNYYQTSDSEEEDQVEEVNPLMYAAYVHDYEGLMEEMKGNDGGVVVSSVAGEFGKDEEYLDEYVAAMMKMKMESSLKRERTTLAELFSADSDVYYSDEMMMQKKLGEEEMVMKHKSIGGKNGKLSFAKKMIIGDHQDGRPAIHKLNRLMRRMLNRKIHPSDMVNVAHSPEDDDNNNNNNNENKVIVPNNNTTTRHAHLPC